MCFESFFKCVTVKEMCYFEVQQTFFSDISVGGSVKKTNVITVSLIYIHYLTV